MTSQFKASKKKPPLQRWFRRKLRSRRHRLGCRALFSDPDIQIGDYMGQFGGCAFLILPEREGTHDAGKQLLGIDVSRHSLNMEEKIAFFVQEKAKPLVGIIDFNLPDGRSTDFHAMIGVRSILLPMLTAIRAKQRRCDLPIERMDLFRATLAVTETLVVNKRGHVFAQIVSAKAGLPQIIERNIDVYATIRVGKEGEVFSSDVVASHHFHIMTDTHLRNTPLIKIMPADTGASKIYNVP